MKNKNSLKIIIPVLLISSSAFVLFQIKKDSTINTQNPNNSININSSDESIASTTFQKLNVLSNRCRGCGKCVRIDPSHFEMNGRIAQVISSADLNSKNLTIAINNCPVQAITLE